MNHVFTQPRLRLFRYVVTTLTIIFIVHGCATPEPKPSVSHKPVIHKQTSSTSDATGERLATIAESMLGSPYKYGGASPKGFDCSGLVYYTHSQLGIRVPRTTGQQAQRADRLSMKEVQPGDILFFRIYGSNISHVGIYTGHNQFVHAPKSGKYVSYASINDPYWRERLVKAGRLH